MRLSVDENYKALKASAGSGKTFALSIRYIALLLSGVSSKKILALTFTKKAANEMQQRVIENFLELHKDNKKSELKELSKMLNKTEDEVIGKRDFLMQDFLKSDIKISTFDSFFSTILRAFSLNFGLNANYDINENLTKFINKEFIKDISKDLGLTHNLADFITQTNSSLDKFLSSINQISNEGIKFEPKNTFFPNDKKVQIVKEKIIKYCENIVASEEPKLVGETRKIYINNIEKTIDQANKLKDKISGNNFSLLKENFMARESLNYATFKRLFADSDVLDDYFLELKDELKAYFIEFEAYKINEFIKILTLFNRIKRDTSKNLNEITFNDLSTIIYELLSDKSMIDMIYFRLDSKIEHILIDEFQDTNVIQYKIMIPLIEEIIAGIGQKDTSGSFFYVGDVKQSIYRFRGGKKELFDHLANRYKQIKTQSLKYNFRSKKLLVDFVNEVFGDKIDDYEPQDVIKEENLNGGYIKVLQAKDDSKDEDVISVLELAVSEVKGLLSKGVIAENIAILCWKNSDIDTLKDMLNNEGINCVGEGNRLLFEIEKIQIVLEYAKFCITKERVYGENVKKLSGKFFPSLEIDYKKSTTQSIIYLIEKLGLGFDDKNILLLIEISSKFNDLAEFVFAEDKTLAINEGGFGVNILTVHKSKGLEFEHIIICDNFSRGANDTDSFLINYDINTESWEMKYRVSGRENIDSEYKKFIEKLALLDKEENLNKLYVAFTRAKTSLIIVKSSTSNSYFINEKSGKNAILDIDNFEQGLVVRDKKTENIVDKKEKNIELVKIPVQKVESNIEFKEQNLRAINFGLAMHYSLEMSENFSLNELEIAIKKAKNKFGKFLNDDEFADIKQRLEKLFNNEKFKDIIFSKKIFKEQPFKFDNKIGQIDLLAIKDDVINIVDYKSAKGFSEHNEEQVKNYKNVFSKLYPSSQVKGYILYILKDNIEIVEV